MTRIVIGNVGKYGLTTDLPANEMPLEAWTDVRNMKMVNGYAERSLGEIVVTGNTLFPPRNVFPSPTAEDAYWIYAGIRKVATVLPGVTPEHTEITRLIGEYNGSLNDAWNGVWMGQVFYLNNGVDMPQVWQPLAPGTRLRDLDNWPADARAKVIRGYKNFVLALDVTEGGARYPSRVKWSDAVEAFNVPPTWDEADPNALAGARDLLDTSGAIVDCLGLGDANIVYKTDSVVVQQFIPTNDVFTWRTISTGVGLMGQGCVAEFKPRLHVMFTREGDLVVNDGITIESVLDKRNLKFIEDNLSETYREYSFLVADSRRKEIWVCYPGLTDTVCTQALVWNWKDNTFSHKSMEATYDIKRGFYDENTVPQSWTDLNSYTWETIPFTWEELALRKRLYQQQLLGAVYTANGLRKHNETYLNATASYTSVLERKGIAVKGLDFRGNPVSDLNTIKLLTEIWPNIDAPEGTLIRIYAGTHRELEDEVEWGPAMPFRVGVDRKVEPLITGRHLAVKFVYSGAENFKLKGYSLEINPAGVDW